MAKKFLISALFLTVIISYLAVSVCSTDVPRISAKSAVLINASDNSVLYSYNSNEKLPMASTTKIMTALTALENCSLDKTVIISDSAIGVEGSSIYLKKGATMTLSDLLYAVLLQSANDAATAVAIEIGGSVENFAHMMNDKAEQLDLKSTHFTNPHGLDDVEHYTTAYDLALTASAALKNPDFRKIVSTVSQQISIDGCVKTIVNHNRLLREYDGCIGVKTGYTKKCGRCLVSAAERDGLTLIAVTLSAPDDWNDHRKLLDYGFSTYKNVKLSGEHGISFDVPLAGSGRFVKVKSIKNLSCCLPSDSERINVKIELPRLMFAPVNKGRVIGKISFFNNNEMIVSSPLTVIEDNTE